MPLDKSGGEAAFKRNVPTLMNEVGKSPHVQSRSQALAIAFALKRRKRAAGGQLKPAGWQTRSEARSMLHSGPINSIVGGRTDHHPMHVAAGSYVLPADHVSSLGQGNTANGHAVLNSMFGSGGKPMGIKRGMGAPRPPHLGKLKDGGVPATMESRFLSWRQGESMS